MDTLKALLQKVLWLKPKCLSPRGRVYLLITFHLVLVRSGFLGHQVPLALKAISLTLIYNDYNALDVILNEIKKNLNVMTTAYTILRWAHSHPHPHPQINVTNAWEYLMHIEKTKGLLLNLTNYLKNNIIITKRDMVFMTLDARLFAFSPVTHNFSLSNRNESNSVVIINIRIGLLVRLYIWRCFAAYAYRKYHLLW